MGNCSLPSKSKASPMSAAKEKSIKNVTTTSNDSTRDGLSDRMVQSHSSDKGDIYANRVKTSPKFVSRIPVRTVSVKRSNLSRSTSFLRTTQSRIPVTLKALNPRETTQPLKVFHHDLECSHSQLNESGFISDFSVTNSGSSQANIEPKNERSSWDTSDMVVHNQPSQRILMATELPAFKNNSSPTIPVRTPIFKEQSPSDGPSIPDLEPVTQLSDSENRRPHSLSCESELLLRKLQCKRMSEIGDSTRLMSPSPIFLEHSGVLQEVSQLKLMLHKLRRSLLQESGDLVQYDSLFRSSTPICSEIKIISREELEQKYEKLLARNIHLERLLESREKVITQLQSDRGSNWNYEPNCLSPNQSNGFATFSPRNYRAISDIPPLQWPKRKVATTQS